MASCTGFAPGAFGPCRFLSLPKSHGKETDPGAFAYFRPRILSCSTATQVGKLN